MIRFALAYLSVLYASIGNDMFLLFYFELLFFFSCICLLWGFLLLLHVTLRSTLLDCKLLLLSFTLRCCTLLCFSLLYIALVYSNSL